MRVIRRLWPPCDHVQKYLEVLGFRTIYRSPFADSFDNSVIFSANSSQRNSVSKSLEIMNTVRIAFLLLLVAAYSTKQNRQKKSTLLKSSRPHSQQDHINISISGSFWSDLAKGNNYRKKILYVQFVDQDLAMISEIPDLFLEDNVLQGREKFCDLKFSEYVKTPKSNIEVLKSGLQNDIKQVYVYSNPLAFAVMVNGFSLREFLKLPKLPSIRDVTIHAFVVFQTFDGVAGKEMWWSMEKNGLNTVLQHSSNKTDVV